MSGGEVASRRGRVVVDVDEDVANRVPRVVAVELRDDLIELVPPLQRGDDAGVLEVPTVDDVRPRRIRPGRRDVREAGAHQGGGAHAHGRPPMVEGVLEVPPELLRMPEV